MAQLKQTTAYFCGECGNEFAKWSGQCPLCKAWNSMVEQPKSLPPAAEKKGSRATPAGRSDSARPMTLSQISTQSEVRFSTGLGELDRVLGGGAVAGSLVLVSGEPGIGKSTLLLQICDSLGRHNSVLYVSGEESLRQIKLRAERLHVAGENLRLLCETDLDTILESVEEINPSILIVDSIQTLFRRGGNAIPGNVSQVKECTMALMQLAKGRGITIFLIGHVNKEGAIAGPKVLEHMVDSVLYFEGERQLSYRMLRATKNRFGPVSEIGMFEMGRRGLIEVPNPSEFLLKGRPVGVSGTCVACVMEGSRPILCEVQALITKTSFGVPRRMVSGLDYNRVMLLLAVLEKRGEQYLGNCDAYVNVVGGFELDEPACDLPVLLACASSYQNTPIHPSVCAIGEVGLAGEVRTVNNLEGRVVEMARLGFTTCIVPKYVNFRPPEGIEIIRVKHVKEALKALWA